MTVGWAMIFGAVSVLVIQAVAKDLKQADERLKRGDIYEETKSGTKIQ